MQCIYARYRNSLNAYLDTSTVYCIIDLWYKKKCAWPQFLLTCLSDLNGHRRVWKSDSPMQTHFFGTRVQTHGMSGKWMTEPVLEIGSKKERARSIWLPRLLARRPPLSSWIGHSFNWGPTTFTFRGQTKHYGLMFPLLPRPTEPPQRPAKRRMAGLS